ncbi:MAG: hypothetical protein QHI48_07735 [Bacteroidota bacterium]|nr:hypothetical protein [Bacteroidota bacterium]
MNHRFPIHLALSLLVLFPSCGKTQDTRPVPTPDSSAHRAVDTTNLSREKRELLRMLDQVRRTVGRPSDTLDAERMVVSTYASFHALFALARAWDRDGAWKEQIDTRYRTFLHEDSLRRGQDGKIINGMLGIHEMLQTLYSMRYSGDERRMSVIDTMDRRLSRLSTRRVQGMEFIAQLAEDIYVLTKGIFEDLDRNHVYEEHLRQIDQSFSEGLKAAESEEDRFLNGMYRTFEVCQLWALSYDPAKRGELQEVYKRMIGETTRREGIGHQMATATEFLYHILDRIAASVIQGAS